MKKISVTVRSLILAALVVVVSFMCGLRLLQIQLVDGAKYLAMTKSTQTATQDIEAARGKIADCNGKILNTNKIVYNVNLQRSSLAQGT